MSEWRVALTFVEGGSSKFWRARIEGNTLYVNYGRIGSGGQTQVKDLASADAAEKELAKLEREKRKKGYVDEGSAQASRDDDEGDDGDEDGDEDGGEEGDEEPDEDDTVEVLKPAAKPRSERAIFVNEAEGRTINLELGLEGNEVRTVVTERYDSPASAKAAYDRLAASMIDEGYRKKN